MSRIRRNKQTDFDPGIVHPLAGVGQGGQIAGHVQTAFRGDLLPPFGHQADNVRLEVERDADDFRRVGHLEIQPCRDGLAYFPDVSVLDMAAVLAQVRRDSVGAGGLALSRGRHRVRFASLPATVPRFPQSGHVIDVYSQLQHLIELWFSLALLRNRFPADDELPLHPPRKLWFHSPCRSYDHA